MAHQRLENHFQKSVFMLNGFMMLPGSQQTVEEPMIFCYSGIMATTPS